MSSKMKRKVTVENTKESSDQPRRPSVFERLGPGALPSSQPQDRHSRIDHNEKCRNWLRSGSCTYGTTCRFTHEVYPNTSKRSSQKAEKEVVEKDLRHKVRKPKEEPKESRAASLSPQRKGKARSSSRSRKGEHEGKIKSTVVVTRPRSPTSGIPAETTDEKKKKPDGSWEEDSDDWPMDAAQLDYKEELTLERKRQQLQRELELELQKERLLNNENVTITKTISFSESSSTTSSSDSGSVSSSSDSSSSSSDDDSDESSSSSSSSSSSGSRTSKKKYKKSLGKKETPAPSKKNEALARKKPLDDYDKIKSSRNAKAAAAAAASRSRLLSPVSPETTKRKSKDYRAASLSPASSPPPRHHRSTGDSSSKGSSRTMRKGPRTPSPLPTRKDRPWGQRSSADSRAGADSKRIKGSKRHKKKKDAGRSDSRKYSDSIPVPPRLSSPNRTVLQSASGKKSLGKDEKLRHKHRDHSPLLAPKYASSSPGNRHAGSHLSESDRHSRKRSKSNQRGRKSDDNLPHSYKLDRGSKHSSKVSPSKDGRQSSISPHRDKHDSENFSRRVYSSMSGDKTDKRKGSPSPGRYDSKDHRKKDSTNRKETRDISPRSHDSRRDSRYQDSDSHHGYNKKNEPKIKRLVSPDVKKGRDDKKDHGHKDRSIDHDPWISESKKGQSSRGHLDDPPSSTLLPPPSRGDRGRDRKKGKDRDLPPLRDDKERDRQRPPSPPIRKGQDVHPHHVIRDEPPPISSARGRLYEADLPADDRDFAYAYPAHREPAYLDERALPPDFDPELLHHHIPPLYPPPPTEAADYPPSVFADPLYRRDMPPLKEPAHIERITGYVPREISPLDPRDPVVLPREIREEDYLDMTLDERRAYDERWGRSRPLRDDWDPFPGALPPPGLDEDRYGMPRRRRASPDWHIHERDLPIRDRRSRSPQHRRSDDQPPRGPWRDDRVGGDRHAPNRANDVRGDNQQKVDDRKNRGYRRDRRDQNKKVDDPPSIGSQKPKDMPKEKPNLKRPHSSSPGRKDIKKKKEEIGSSGDFANPTSTVAAGGSAASLPDKRKSSSSKTEVRNQTDVASPESLLPKHREESSSHLIEKSSFYLMQLMESSSSSAGSSKKSKDDVKQEAKMSASRKTAKALENTASVKQEHATVPIASKSVEKKETQEKASKSSGKSEAEEKKKHSNNDDKSQVDDDFSDWSDGDDDLLSRDLNDVEPNADKIAQGKPDDTRKEKKSTLSDLQTSAELKESKDSGKRKRDVSKDSRSRANDIRSESRSRNGSKERPPPPTEGSDSSKADAQSLKDNDLPEPYVIKDEAVGEPDDFVTTESVDYDPISDDELEAMIEEPNDVIAKISSEEGEKTKIVDALDVDWSVLVNDSKPEFVPGNAKKRFKTAHVLSRIGFSQVLAGDELSEKIIKFCQNQMDEEKDADDSTDKKFQMEHNVAALHTTLAERKKERDNLFSRVGPARRALCARQDLYIRKLLCRPSHKLVLPSSCLQQHGNVDSKNQKVKSLENQVAVVNTAC